MRSPPSTPGLAALALGLTLAGALFGAPAAMAQDTTPPTLERAEVDRATLTLHFNEALDETSVPPTDAFVVKGRVGNLAGSSPVVIDGSTVTLTLATPVREGERVRMFYASCTDKIQDLAGNVVERIPTTDVDNLTDETPPAFVSATTTTDGMMVIVTFNETLAAAGSLANSAFTVKKTPKGGSEQSVNLVGTPSVSAATVTLTLESAVLETDIDVTVSYEMPTAGTGNQLQDESGNEVVSFRPKDVTNARPDTIRPMVRSAWVEGTALSILFDEALAATSVPAAGAFMVKKTPRGGSEQAVNLVGSPSVSGGTVILTLSSAVAGTDTGVKVSYTEPTSGSDNRLRDASGNQVGSFTNQPVDYTDTTPPTIVNVTTVSGATLTLNFNEALDETSVPAPSAFRLFVFGVNRRKSDDYPAKVAIRNGSAVRLTLAEPLEAYQGVKVGYARRPGSGAKLRDLYGNEVESTYNPRLAHRLDDTTPPVFVGARTWTDGTGVDVDFHEVGVPPTSWWTEVAPAITLTVDGEPVAISRTGRGTYVAIQYTLWLTLSQPIRLGQTVEISYDKTALADPSHRLQDRYGNEVESFGPEAVTNDSLASPTPPPPTPSPTERAPVADAGEGLAVEPGAALRLDGSGSLDPDGDALTFAWSQTAGEAVALQGADTATPSFEAPAAPGVLRFQLTVSDPGGLTASDTVTVRVGAVAVHHVPLFASAAHPKRDGFVRIINHSCTGDEVSIVAIDDAGMEYGPLWLRIGAKEAAHFSSRDLEAGNAERGLSGGVGEGDGDWRLELMSVLDLEVFAYGRARDGGALSSLHGVVPQDEAGHRVVFFNPASNASRVSWLRLINPGDDAAAVRIIGIDDAGEAGESAVELTLAPRASRTLSAQALESGEGEGLSGALGDGEGKWRLRVSADQPLRVMSLLASGPHLTNVSTAPERIREESEG